MWRRSTIGAALAALVATAVVGCGGASGNGVAAKTPNEIVAAATRAIDAVHSVRVSGSVADAASSHTITLDLHVLAGRGATGSLAEGPLSFSLVTTSGEAYINADPAFWRQFAGPAAESLLRGRWLRGSATTGRLASFSSLANVRVLVASVLAGHGGLIKEAVTTIGGRRAIAVHDASRGGTLYVATSGPPYPLRIVAGGARRGQLDFSEFNRPVTLTAPASSIDSSQLTAPR